MKYIAKAFILILIMFFLFISLTKIYDKYEKDAYIQYLMLYLDIFNVEQSIINSSLEDNKNVSYTLERIDFIKSWNENHQKSIQTLKHSNTLVINIAKKIMSQTTYETININSTIKYLIEKDGYIHNYYKEWFEYELFNYKDIISNLIKTETNRIYNNHL